jgi:hypothetical protein
MMGRDEEGEGIHELIRREKKQMRRFPGFDLPVACHGQQVYSTGT